ncbi:MAG: hypothetical protein QXV47_07310 [Fervidicoccaceae archaeon]
MAKITVPLMSASASGKLADVVFFRRGDFAINVARLRVVPANPRTEKQQAVRHNIRTLTQIWKTGQAGGKYLYKRDPLTDTWTQIQISPTESFTAQNKEAWTGYYVVTRKGYKVDGRLAFISTNQKRLYEGQDPLKTPTTTFTLAT